MSSLTNRLAVVGDVHGNISRLAAMFDRIGSLDDRTVVLVGDYVDRGPDSRSVLQLIIERSESASTVPLLGNHEREFLLFMDGGSLSRYAHFGGIATILSYVPEAREGIVADVSKVFRERVPRRHVEFVRSLKRCWESDELLITHAGFDPSRPEGRTYEDVTRGGAGDLFRNPEKRPRAEVVFGHYVQRSGIPYSRDGLYCVDTGCGTRADLPLCALLLPEHEWIFT